MDSDEERKRKTRERKRKNYENQKKAMPEKFKLRHNEQMKKHRIAKKAKMTEKDRVIEREKRRLKMREYRSRETREMTHHGAKPLAPRGAGIPTDADDLMGNFVFPVQSESDKDEEDFYLPSDEEHDDFFKHHDFGPGSGGAGMAVF